MEIHYEWLVGSNIGTGHTDIEDMIAKIIIGGYLAIRLANAIKNRRRFEKRRRRAGR